MVRAFIGLGSNLENPIAQLDDAIEAMKQLQTIGLMRVSSCYKSKPMGPQDQDDYINAVVEIETELEAEALLDILQQIEQQQGRIRTRHWGPRTLDLDILLYGNMEINTERLVIPHPGITERNFVLFPLVELVGDEFVIPGKGPVGKLALECDQLGIEKIQE